MNGTETDIFKIEQSYRNAIRQEYKAAGATILPEYSVFEGPLDADIPLTSLYDRKDIPKVSKIHNLRNNLLKDKYRITSSYRNPYKNLSASDTGVNSRHCWSGALDVKDSTWKGGTEELKNVWDDARTKSAVLGQILVESAPDGLKKAVTTYVQSNLLRAKSTISY